MRKILHKTYELLFGAGLAPYIVVFALVLGTTVGIQGAVRHIAPEYISTETFVDLTFLVIKHTFFGCIVVAVILAIVGVAKDIIKLFDSPKGSDAIERAEK
jgi:hypothetical protein